MTSKPTVSSQPVRLNELETQILLVLASSSLHGYGIAKELERRDPDGPRLFPTNLYRRLRELAVRGLIEPAGVELDESGRARKNFKITSLGHKSLREASDRFAALLAALQEQGLTSPESSPK